MAEDLFGNEIPEDEETDLEDDTAQETEEVSTEETTEEDGETEEQLQAEGDEPDDLEAARKYWQAAYTKSRQKDRERYGKMEQEYQQYQTILNKFYEDDIYARQVLAQRFPGLAQQLGQAGQAPATGGSRAGQSSDLASRLEQKLGEFGFLAQGLAGALEEEIEARVTKRVAPLEQRTMQQTAAQRKAEEDRLLTEMDGKYPGWEDSVGAKMRTLDEFLASNTLNHPEFGNKYELYYRLLNPDATRADAIREMGAAAKRRTSLSRSSRSTAPNIDQLVRKAESNSDAFRAAAKAALDELG